MNVYFNTYDVHPAIIPPEVGYRRPSSGGYRRPDPWVYTVAPFDRLDPDGLHYTTDTWGHFEVTDQWRHDKPATNLELYQLAADEIPGAGILVSDERTYIGEDAAQYNQRVHKILKGEQSLAAHLLRAVVVFGATPEQFHPALEAVHRESQQIKAVHETARLFEAYLDIVRDPPP